MAEGGNWRDDSEPEWDLRQRGLLCQSYHQMAEGGSWRDESEPQVAPRPSGLHCPNSQFQVHSGNASVETCIMMNWLGYGPEMRQARRDAYREQDRIRNARDDGNMHITTGSKAEGLTRSFESDLDVMLVIRDVLCIEDGVKSDILPRENNVFRLSTIMCYPGYCRLLLERSGIMYRVIVDALCDDEYGRSLLCSDLFVYGFKRINYGPNVVAHDRAGPSMPSSINGIWHVDTVFSIPCHCPSILQRWAERRRNWPSPAVVQKVVSLGAYVTPVGFKGSQYRHVEWRICFNTGENELVGSLNNTQVYVYVILKMVVKEVLKPVNKEITSYTVKNIVLWLAENNPQNLFHERSLFVWVCEGLGELRTAILTKRLQYYMIPERNLMGGCGIAEEQQRSWVATITDMINDGPKLILRLPKIRQAIISHPEPLMWYSKKRVELELIVLKCRRRKLQCTDENGVIDRSDPIYQAIYERMYEILIEVRQRMNWEGSRLNDLFEISKMMLS
ncbi:uncharacterized protein LOC127869415 isoform X3 [Dreissena polymorpha]|nr:uncharacterized protein LOC127869415 isoform X3 [Dreissena polymorpha]XP_052267935.1 uncharacterized protein LOC127869415 isoform X3 [Dreissena polymorpha]